MKIITAKTVSILLFLICTGTFTTQTMAIEPAPHYEIYNRGDLIQIEYQSDPIADFILMNDIEITDDIWRPIGSSKPFSGNFEGNNHTITFTKEVTFQHPINSRSDEFGLFGKTKDANISNLNLVFNGNATGGNNTGALVGIFNSSQNSIVNCTVQSSNHTISGNNNVGGLIGNLVNGNIENSSSDFSVKAEKSNAGGLIGYVLRGNISNSYAAGSVEANKNAGGFIGYISDKTILQNSTANGSVKPAGEFGNFIGDWDEEYKPTVIDCYYNDTEVDLEPVDLEPIPQNNKSLYYGMAICGIILLIAAAIISYSKKKKNE